MNDICNVDNTLNGFLIGSLLGDGSFCRKTPRHNTYVRFSQCAKQAGYLGWKYDFLRNRGMIRKKQDVKIINPDTRHCYPNAQMQYSFSTKSFSFLNRYKEEPKSELIKEMNEMSMAVFIMDDGNIYERATKISCGTLTDEEREAFVEIAKSKFGLDVRIYKSKQKSTHDYFAIPSSQYETVETIVKRNIPDNIDVVKNKLGSDSGNAQVKIKYRNKEMSKLYNVGGIVSDWVDLRCEEEVAAKAGEYFQISLGVSMKLPEGYEAIVAPRSSTFKKYGIIMVNSIGVIDNSYCGDGDIWQFPAYAVKNTVIPKNERICQFRILKHQPALRFEEVETLGNPDRGGFGSTDFERSDAF